LCKRIKNSVGGIMRKKLASYKSTVGRRGLFLGTLGMLMVSLLVLVACGGGDAAPTAIPSTATPKPVVVATATTASAAVVPATATAAPDAVEVEAEPTATTSAWVPTATAQADVATAVPAATAVSSSELRPLSEWTCDEPGTQLEIEAELENHRGESFTFIGWGGQYQDSQRYAWFDPLQENWGITVHEVSPVQVGAIRAAGELGDESAPPWNVVAISGQAQQSWADNGVLEILDCRIHDNSGWPEHIKSPYWGGGAISWGWTQAYSTDTFPDGGAQPQTMHDVYNVDKFPGRRGFWNTWVSNLRYVLMASDVAPYTANITDETKAALLEFDPDEVEQAFEALEVRRDRVDEWYSGYTRCPEAVTNGDLDFCMMDTGMAYDAWADDLPSNICWSCGIVAMTDQMSVINGTSLDPVLGELVHLAMGWMATPAIHPQSSKYIGYGPVNQDSFAYMQDDPAYAETGLFLPTSDANFPYAIYTDEIADGLIQDAMVERWAEWQAGCDAGICD
jgi:putative spermidine/putrescine transport system substrate-binding protein